MIKFQFKDAFSIRKYLNQSHGSAKKGRSNFGFVLIGLAPAHGTYTVKVSVGLNHVDR
ncbi:hypothetical protein P3T20_002710 [Paraburkholderia sp. GAS206C]